VGISSVKVLDDTHACKKIECVGTARIGYHKGQDTRSPPAEFRLLTATALAFDLSSAVQLNNKYFWSGHRSSTSYLGTFFLGEWMPRLYQRIPVPAKPSSPGFFDAALPIAQPKPSLLSEILLVL